MTVAPAPPATARYWCQTCRRIVVAIVTTGPTDTVVCAGTAHLVTHPAPAGARGALS